MRPPLEAFKRAYIASNEAFNSHDFEGAFGGLGRDFEWYPVAGGPETAPLRGGEGVIEAFRGLVDEFPDWRVDPQEFVEAGETIVVRNVATATGRSSGVPIRQEFSQVWTFRDGRSVQVREYFDHGDALRAAETGEGG